MGNAHKFNFIYLEKERVSSFSKCRHTQPHWHTQHTQTHTKSHEIIESNHNVLEANFAEFKLTKIFEFTMEFFSKFSLWKLK